jgi:GH15 family glucan-1,4-alpha-glucosidase
LQGDAAVSEFLIGAGQQVAFELTWSQTHHPDPPELNAQQTLEDAQRWWLDWSGQSQYRGPWQKDVLASLLVLKALTYRPTGGIVAAPTTSLPEHLGGSRNWDYRYCWLRDATFTLYAFLVGGYIEEARAWRQWLVNAAAGMPSQLQIMYGISGERRLTELHLPWLPGYAGSQPVRIGNAAYSQRQLDVPGEIMEALHLARRQGLPASSEAWRVQCAVMDFLESAWRETDEGIWEIRGKSRHFTHSKVMAWVAADRAVREVEHFGLQGDVDKWRRLRDEIHAQVCAEGYNQQLGAFVQYYGASEPDASLLMLPLVGFLDAHDPRMQGTVRLIEERLVHDGFVERYATETNVDGLPAGEGAFLLCSFWLADNYSLAGRHAEARDLFTMLLGLRNDVGLLAEEYMPQAGRMLGNFPQAFSHIGLVNTARNLAEGAGPAEDRANENVQPVNLSQPGA